MCSDNNTTENDLREAILQRMARKASLRKWALTTEFSGKSFENRYLMVPNKKAFLRGKQ